MHERRDLDLLVAAMRISRVPGAEVDRVDAVRREVGDVRPGLLGRDFRAPASTSAATRGCRDDAPPAGVARDVQRRARGNERAQKASRLLGVRSGG